MKIVVCIKQVPNTSEVKINPDGEYTPMIQEFLNYVIQTIESVEATQQNSNEMPTLQ